MPRINSTLFYTKAIEKYGATAQGVNWTSPQTQNLRFEMLLELLPTHINTLVDAGCGFGDFYTYVLQSDSRSIKNYVGIDCLENMCEIARRKTKQTILFKDITNTELPKAEFYVCSGAMNILTPYETHLFIRNCLQSSSIGFVFNVLHGDKESEIYNYLTTTKIKEIAKMLQVKRVEIKEQYMDNDITVGFFHV